MVRDNVILHTLAGCSRDSVLALLEKYSLGSHCEPSMLSSCVVKRRFWLYFSDLYDLKVLFHWLYDVFVLLLLPPTSTRLFVCQSVCKIRSLKNACMDLDEMLCVDRCQDMNELINFLSPIRIIVRMPEPNCFLWYRIGYETLQPCLGCQQPVLIRAVLRRENPT